MSVESCCDVLKVKVKVKRWSTSIIEPPELVIAQVLNLPSSQHSSRNRPPIEK